MFKCHTVFILRYFAIFFLFGCLEEISILKHPVLVSVLHGMQIKIHDVLAFRLSICHSGSRNVSYICLQRCVLWYSVISRTVQRLVTIVLLYELCCWLFICIF